MPVLVAGGPLQGAGLFGGAPLINQGGIGFGGAKLAVLGPLAEELDGYKEEFHHDGQQTVTRRWKVLWGGRKMWVDNILGYSNTVLAPPPAGFIGGASSYQLSRVPPDNVPETGYEHLYCSSCEMEDGKGGWANNPNVFAHDGQGNVVLGANGLPVQAPMIAYFDPGTRRDGLAIYSTRWTSRPYEIRSDAELTGMNSQASTIELERYVERERSCAVQSLPLPAGSVKFLSGPHAGDLVAAASSYILLQTTALKYTWHEIPDYPQAAVDACVGLVNAATFDGARGAPSYPAGTLLCQAPLAIVRYRHTTGRVYWRITYSFLYKNVGTDASGAALGWNALPDAGGYFAPVGRVNDGTPLYELADFNKLFQPPNPLTYQ